MTPPDATRWAAILSVFDELAALEAPLRQARLEAIGRADPDMRSEVEELFASDAQASLVLAKFDVLAPEQTTPRDPLQLVGRTVSRFQVQECIGQGGMGVVYRAVDNELGRRVALKVPLGARHENRTVIERFRREARVAAGLEHPNLCPVYEIGETPDGDLFYAMPFYDGETLKSAIARREKLPARDALAIAAQIARGLGALHKAGIVHRDLKPANVMLLEDGSVKILDFGLAKGNDASLTATSSLMGTVAYMAPEQASNDKLDGRADLWALGVVLFEMVTGQRPFTAGNEIGTLHAILHRDAPVPSSISTSVPPLVDDVVQRCLRKDPAQRYESAEALLDALNDIQQDSAQRASADVRPHDAAVGRRRAWPVTLAVAGAMLVAVLVWIRRPTDPASPSAAAPLPLPTLAIIPPAKLGGEPSDDYLVSAFTEELGAMLNRTRGVSVPGYLSTALLAKRGVAPRVIGDSLGAGYVLEGTLGARADTVIIGLQLSRVADNGILWSSNFSGSTGDLGRIERDVADSLLRVLHPTKRMVSTSQLLTSNPEAANLYRRARFKWSQREKASLNDALVDLNGAIQLDPNFAMAYASMAEVYVNLSNFGFLKQSEALTSATLAADKALSLDSVLAPALASRGFVLASQGRYAEAEASLRRSIGLNPDIQWSHHYYSLLLTMLGRFKEATNEIETALKLDPLARPAKTQLGVLRQAQGDLNGAREQLRKALAIAPDFQLVLSALGEVEAALGDYRAALPLLERANELSPDFPTVRGDLAYVYDKLGQTPKSRRLLTEARRAVTDDRSRVNYALTLGVLGQADSAFTLLRSAVWDVPTLIQLRVDPLLRDFRADPRYPKLLAQFGLTP